MKFSALLRDILFLATNNGTTSSPPASTSTSTTSSPTTPTPTPSLLPRQGQGFTDPNLISQPTTFYETASALIISNGRTYTTTYIDLISATAAFPVTPSTTTTTTPLTIATTPTPKPTTNPLVSSSATFISGKLSLAAPSSPPPPPPPPSPSPSSPSPILNLAPCSTFTLSENALEGCISSVLSALSLTGGGPIIATSTGITATAAVASTARGEGVTPTRTVTMPFLGKVVAKGEATFVVVKEGEGGRGRGRGRGMLVGVGVGLMVVMVGRGFGGCWEWWGF